MYVFDCPITRAEFYTDGYMGCQGCAATIVTFYNCEEKIFTACQKEHVTSLCFHIGACADPRIVATHIFAARLMSLGEARVREEEKLCEEINAVINPIFTREAAIEWLEKNFFIGENALFRRAVACGDCKTHDYQKKKYPECWLWDGFPGWDIWYLERELAYVPPQAREVYDKYYSAWKEAKRKREQKEKEERRKEAKRKLEEEKQILEAEKRKLGAAKQKKAPPKHTPKAPLTPKEAEQNWNEIIKTYERIEQKKKGK